MSSPAAADAFPAPIRARLWAAGRWSLYVSLTIAWTWPLALHLNTAIPQGSQPAATVPLFNLWTTWWNADRLREGLAGYWDAPIFHPTRGAFAFSEPQPTLLLVAPFAWWGSPVLAMNVYLLVSLVLNGWLAERLLRQRGHPGAVAFAGGVLCLSLPCVYWQLGVLQSVPLWGVLWTLLSLGAVAERPTFRRGVGLGVAFGVTYLACNYYGLYLSVLLLVCAPVLLGGRLLERRTWSCSLAAILTAAVIVGPVVSVQLTELLAHQFVREPAAVRGLATTWRDYLFPTGTNWLPTARLAEGVPRRWDLSPGHVKVLLAAIGVACGLWAGGARRWTLFWTLLLAAAVVLASGPFVSVGSWNLHEHLVRHWPGFAQVRSLYRFAVFAQIAVVMLACEALSFWWPAAAARWRRGRCGAAMLLAAGAVLEVTPPRANPYHPPLVTDTAHWAVWLREHAPADAVVTHVPFPRGTSEQDHQTTTLAMYWQTVHHRRLVEGYSGFFPESYRQLKRAMQTFPDATALVHLDLAGATHCVVYRRELPADRRAAVEEWSNRLQLVYADDRRDVAIYVLRSPSPAVP
jgi:hypothetical protein